MSRTFDDQPAVRERVPLLVGVGGASGSGKTFSAIRLATGMRRVVGGEIFVIDTESRRALHYADRFDFRHLEFKPPFGPLDYLAAIEHCAGKGASVVIIDSMSHEHEGPGGVLEMHDAELDRLAGQDYQKRNKLTFLAWSKPKQERRRLINSVLQLGVNLICCFRAKQKLKMVRGKDPVELGWMPIGGEEFVFEMTTNVLLYPASGGIPTWKPDMPGERAMVKLPVQFEEIFDTRQPLNEDIGELLAQWAAGSVTDPVTPEEIPDQEMVALIAALEGTSTRDGVLEIARANRERPWSPAQRDQIKAVVGARLEATPAETPRPCQHPDGFAPIDDSPDRVCIHCGICEADAEF